jgi:hypothetical protein
MAFVPTGWNGATIGFQYLAPNTGTIIDDDGFFVVGIGVEGVFGDSFDFPIFCSDVFEVQIGLEASTVEAAWDPFPFDGPRVLRLRALRSRFGGRQRQSRLKHGRL